MDRFEIADTYYWWLADHHEGQWSRKYERLSQLSRSYSPSPLARTAENPEAYAELCRREGCKHDKA
jgi:hypothetical protein